METYQERSKRRDLWARFSQRSPNHKRFERIGAGIIFYSGTGPKAVKSVSTDMACSLSGSNGNAGTDASSLVRLVRGYDWARCFRSLSQGQAELLRQEAVHVR